MNDAAVSGIAGDAGGFGAGPEIGGRGTTPPGDDFPTVGEFWVGSPVA